ncbi:MauE/DoxX family redox-associated membrane protein [Herbidospora yilanensis]|uniref:MauE/DoxX family redox-associated membrane protein n=1 Tax=Herbidospora yilanensis TaxID=354426 RepID=UPI000784A9E9|nr:MauE/DoxX family redox-associated membrane protein [Herbidospora yilanensis]
MILIGDVALAGALLLVAAGFLGAGEVTRGHGLLPSRVIRAAALAGPVVGGAAIGFWVWGDPGRYAWTAAAVWHTALAGYLLVLLGVRGRVPCGCLDAVTPVSPVKAGVGAVWAAASAAMAAGVVPVPGSLSVRLPHLALAGFAALLAVVAASVWSVSSSSPRRRIR